MMVRLLCEQGRLQETLEFVRCTVNKFDLIPREKSYDEEGVTLTAPGGADKSSNRLEARNDANWVPFLELCVMKMEKPLGVFYLKKRQGMTICVFGLPHLKVQIMFVTFPVDEDLF